MSLAIDIPLLEQTIKQCGNPDALAEAASGLKAVGSSIGSTGSQLVSRWQALSGCYFAPETAQLVNAIRPVQTKTDFVSSSVGPISSALTTLAGEISAIKPKLESLLEEAKQFAAYAAAHPNWDKEGTVINKASGELAPNTGNGSDAVANANAQHWHDRIAQEIRLYTQQLAMFGAECANTIKKYIDYSILPDVSGADSKPGQVPWDVQILQGKDPFGSLWIDKGPAMARFGAGFTFALTQGIAGLTGLVGLGFTVDPVTGDVRSNFGLHTIQASWKNLGEMAVFANVLPFAGSLIGAAVGHPGLLNAYRQRVGGIIDAVDGKGLPGGWAYRSGYIFGNVAQAAAPGPGKLAIGTLAEKEIPMVSAMARAAEAGAKGRWFAGDARVLLRATGLSEKARNALLGLERIQRFNEHFQAFKTKLHLSTLAERSPQLTDHHGFVAAVDHQGNDVTVRTSTMGKPVHSYPPGHGGRPFTHALEESDRINPEAKSVPSATRSTAEHVPSVRKTPAQYDPEAAALRNGGHLLSDHGPVGHTVPPGETAALRNGGHLLSDPGRSAGEAAPRVPSPVKDAADPGAEAAVQHLPSPVKDAMERTKDAMQHRVESAFHHSKDAMRHRVESAFRHSKDAVHHGAEAAVQHVPSPVKDVVRHAVDNMRGSGHVELREGFGPYGGHQQMVYAHEFRGRKVVTVLGGVHDKELVRLKNLYSYFEDTGELAPGVPLPKEVKELYSTQFGKSAWEAIPFHHMREDAAQYGDYQERSNAPEEERRRALEELKIAPGK